ncbi:MAG: metallophosphoesterase family protein [Verrucomicrobia bacterium]|jgi:hypothetical protein|nr:metallophosphoesterase family protein [Verrucomicrobiota bacterium]MBT7064914.1 metallophosphoesterase family protein [Verrucomicrobiota bacterium]MBT7699959.1 metallophosphoesterase family protein [Verrucomicrobiota bacterium]
MRVSTIVLLCLVPMVVFGETGQYRLSWRSDPATSMVIGWDQRSGGKPEVCYDTVDHDRKAIAYRWRQKPDRVVSYRGMSNHFVRLENLVPDTPYYFMVCDSEGVGRRLWFRTAPATPQPFTFIAGGDSRTNPEPRREGNKLVAKLRPLFVLFGGDYTGSGKPGEWQGWFNDWQLTISEDGRLYPIIATHGNHENGDLQMMSELFDTPSRDQFFSLGIAGELLRIWVLNSELEGKAKDRVALQQAWIEKDLPQHADTTWKLATYHRPMRPHTAGKSEGLSRIAAWAQLFYDQGVDLVVESDTHMVKRSYPVRPSEEAGSYESFIRDDARGMIFIGEGSWGAPTRPTNDDKPWTMASDSFHQFKWIHVHPEEILIRTATFEGVEKVETLTETNRFDLPADLVWWEPETGPILRLPFDVTHASYHAPVKPVTLLALGEVWEWSLDGTTWAAGLAPLGYGDSQVRTAVVAGDAKPLCAYFRRSIEIEDPASVARLFFDLMVDDGCIVTLNGKEVLRHNMPRGKITAQTLATQRATSLTKKQAVPRPVDPRHLQPGLNTIEVRVHQYEASSSDIVFDLGVRIKR